jgi:hypothetical protein
MLDGGGAFGCEIAEHFAMEGLSKYLVNAARPSSRLEVARIRAGNAERLLAAIWCILETHSLTPPVIDVDFANGLFDISLTFRSARDCALVENSLPHDTR